jgi:hypothetical protein
MPTPAARTLDKAGVDHGWYQYKPGADPCGDVKVGSPITRCLNRRFSSGPLLGVEGKELTISHKCAPFAVGHNRKPWSKRPVQIYIND